MAKQTDPAATWRIIQLAGFSDIAIGLGLIVAGLTDLLGPDLELLSIVGGVIALVGVGLVIWTRSKLSQADTRRGDLN